MSTQRAFQSKFEVFKREIVLKFGFVKWRILIFWPLLLWLFSKFVGRFWPFFGRFSLLWKKIWQPCSKPFTFANTIPCWLRCVPGGMCLVK